MQMCPHQAKPVDALCLQHFSGENKRTHSVAMEGEQITEEFFTESWKFICTPRSADSALRTRLSLKLSASRVHRTKINKTPANTLSPMGRAPCNQQRRMVSNSKPTFKGFLGGDETLVIWWVPLLCFWMGVEK
ncbi:unnamed protein product [Lota lota]